MRVWRPPSAIAKCLQSAFALCDCAYLHPPRFRARASRRFFLRSRLTSSSAMSFELSALVKYYILARSNPCEQHDTHEPVLEDCSWH